MSDELIPLRFISEPIEVEFEEPPLLEKKPPCPDFFTWRERRYAVVEMLSEWHDYSRRGRMKRNMRPGHAEVAAHRGSWGVGRFFFRVRTNTNQIFDIYYDRAPLSSSDRKGSWHIFREMGPRPPRP